MPDLTATASAPTPPTTSGSTSDEEALAARLTWLESAGSDDDVRVIERALLVETDNSAHEGDPEEDPS